MNFIDFLKHDKSKVNRITSLTLDFEGANAYYKHGIFKDVYQKLALCKNLAELTISNLPVANNRKQQLKIYFLIHRLQFCENLVKLCFRACNLNLFSTQTIRALSESLIKCSKLQCLKINKDTASSFKLEQWSALCQAINNCKNINELDLSDFGLHAIPKTYWRQLAEKLHLTKLKTLVLQNNLLAILNDDKLEGFREFISAIKQIETIDLSNSYNIRQIQNDDSSEESGDTDEEEMPTNKLGTLIMQLTTCPSLKVLILNDSTKLLQDAEFILLSATLPKLRKLSALELSRSYISEFRCSILQQSFSSCHTLQSIKVAGMHYQCVHGNYGCIHHLPVIDSFCAALSKIPNITTIDFTPDVNSPYRPEDYKEIVNACSKYMLNKSNLCYIRGLGNLPPTNLRMLYAHQNSLLMLNSLHQEFNPYVIGNYNLLRSWYASIAVLLNQHKLHSDMKGVIDLILEFWLPALPKLFIEVLKAPEHKFITLESYDFLKKKNTELIRYEPLTFRKLKGQLQLCSLNQAIDEDVSTFFAETQDVKRTKVVSPRVRSSAI